MISLRQFHTSAMEMMTRFCFMHSTRTCTKPKKVISFDNTVSTSSIYLVVVACFLQLLFSAELDTRFGMRSTIIPFGTSRLPACSSLGYDSSLPPLPFLSSNEFRHCD
jgi:hypothetical protein